MGSSKGLCALRPRQSRAELVQNLHFGKPALLHWNPAQHASSFCFTSSPTMHLACVASDDTPHQPEHNFVRVIPYINSPFFTNGMPSMQIGFVQACFSGSIAGQPDAFTLTEGTFLTVLGTTLPSISIVLVPPLIAMITPVLPLSAGAALIFWSYAGGPPVRRLGLAHDRLVGVPGGSRCGAARRPRAAGPAVGELLAPEGLRVADLARRPPDALTDRPAYG